MTPRERGFLLLTSPLGNPERRVLTAAQMRFLANRIRNVAPGNPDRELTALDLRALGLPEELGRRIAALLDEEDLLDAYLRRGAKAGWVPVTRVTLGYPMQVRRRLGLDSPGSLWVRGDLSLLARPLIGLVGSRDLNPPNQVFAAEAGRQAAEQGFALVSGNARGADRTAQEHCLANGGTVICVAADSGGQPRPGVLTVCEDGFDLPFTAQRALSRNRVIHSLASRVLVAQCGMGIGGTWSGTTRNLRGGWSPVFCFDDGSSAVQALCGMGACAIGISDLKNLNALEMSVRSLFDGE